MGHVKLIGFGQKILLSENSFGFYCTRMTQILGDIRGFCLSANIPQNLRLLRAYFPFRENHGTMAFSISLKGQC
jgi:hypothetical protein